MRRIRLILGLLVLTMAATAAPVAAEDPVTIPVVSGAIVLPEGAVVLEGATVNVQLQDTSLQDVAAVVISSLSMEGSDVASPIPFALSYVLTSLQGPGPFTLNVRIEAEDGSLLFINDTMTPGVADTGPLTDVVVDVIAVG